MTISLAAPTDNTGAIRNNGSDVLTIDSSNNIGVGTSSPLTTLNISGGIGAASGTETTTQTNSLFALSATGTNTRLYQGIQSGSVVWLQAQNTDNSTKAISLNPAGGNVGIGTSSPTEGKLVVRNDSGDAKLNIKVNSFDGTNGVAALDFSTGGQGANDPQARIHALGANNYSSDIVFSIQQSGTANPLVERMRLNSLGRLGINITNPIAALHVKGNNNPTSYFQVDANGNQGIIFRNASNTTVGNITVNASTTAYNTSSDYRLKENVAPMSGSIDRLKQLKPSTWSWIQDGSHGEGFVAHEAQAVIPEAVTGTKDAVDDEGNPVYQGIDQAKLVPLLTAALQEAITKIETLETRIQALESN